MLYRLRYLVGQLLIENLEMANGSEFALELEIATTKLDIHRIRDGGENRRNLGRKKYAPLTDPETLSQAVPLGVLNALHLVGSGVAPGKVTTRPLAGQQGSYQS